jgi:hypothetical protein
MSVSGLCTSQANRVSLTPDTTPFYTFVQVQGQWVEASKSLENKVFSSFMPKRLSYWAKDAVRWLE